MKPSHAHQSPLPTGILVSSNRVPEICDQIDGTTRETGTGTQAKRSRFRSPVFFSGESDCVSDDWNDRTTQSLDSVCKLCCLMNRRGLGSVLREISADHRQLDCAAGFPLSLITYAEENGYHDDPGTLSQLLFPTAGHND